jgi:hypothetical protein
MTEVRYIITKALKSRNNATSPQRGTYIINKALKGRNNATTTTYIISSCLSQTETQIFN